MRAGAFFPYTNSPGAVAEGVTYLLEAFAADQDSLSVAVGLRALAPDIMSPM